MNLSVPTIGVHSLLFLLAMAGAACTSRQEEPSRHTGTFPLKPFKHLVLRGEPEKDISPIVRFAPSFSLRCDSLEEAAIKRTYRGDTLIITIPPSLEYRVCDSCDNSNYNPYSHYDFAIAAPAVESISSLINFKLREVKASHLLIRQLTEPAKGPAGLHTYTYHAFCSIEQAVIDTLRYEGRNTGQLGAYNTLIVREDVRLANLLFQVEGNATLEIDPSVAIPRLFLRVTGQFESKLGNIQGLLYSR